MTRNRRHFARYVTNSPVPVCLGPTNGTLHNLGEGGLAVDAPYGSDSQVISVSLESGSQPIEANALIVWRDHSKNRMGLKFVDLSETTRQQIKKLLSLGLTEDSPEARMAAKQRLGEPQSMKSLFTLSSLATSEDALPLRDTPRIEEADEDLGPLTEVPTRRLPVAGWICLGSLLLVLLVALFQFPDTMLSLWSSLTSTDIDSFSSSTADPPISLGPSTVSASSAATVPAADSVNPASPPSTSPRADATLIARIEVFPTPKQTNVRVSGNGRLSYRALRLSNPERLVLDFSGVRMGFSQASVPSASGPVQRIRLSQFKPDVARVVIDLDGAVLYNTKSDDHSLTVAFTPSGLVPTTALVPRSKATKSPVLSAGAAPKVRPNGSQ